MNEKISDRELMDSLRTVLDEKDCALEELELAYKKLEDTNMRLIESERSKSDFLAELRNEINNPMASILVLSEQMAETDMELEMYKQAGTVLYKEALALDFQMQNILTAAEIEAGEVAFNVSKVDVNAIVESKLKDFKSLIADKGLEVKRNTEEPVWVDTDAEKLNIIVGNLICNGIIFNEDKGLLDISIDVVDDELVFSVRDGGIGISEDDQGRIFNRFVQLDDGISKKFRGLGLGLSVSDATAELLRGKLDVKSDEDKGSIFTLRCPAATSADVDTVFMDGADIFVQEGDEGVF